MPAYDYDCAACGRRFEVVHGVHADPPTSCPLCGKGPIRKAITAAAVHYRGSGWAKKERRATASSGSKAQSDSNGSSDAGSSTDKVPSSDKGSSPETATSAPAKAADSRASSTTD